MYKKFFKVCDETLRGKELDWALLILRVVIGLFFIYHGQMKFSFDAGVDGFAGMLGKLGLPFSGVLAYLVFFAEFFGGLAILLGVLVRFSAFWQLLILLEIFFKVKGGAWAKGELEIVAFGAVALLFLVGPGAFSLSSYFRKKKGVDLEGV